MTSRIPESLSPDAAWSERERELFDAARQDRMPAALEARLREALDLSLAPTTPSTAQPEAVARVPVADTSSARQLFVGKLPLWGVLSVIALGAVTGSYFALIRSGPQTGAAAKLSDTGSSPAQRLPLTAATATSTSANAERNQVGLALAREALGVAPAAHGGMPAVNDQLRIEAELLASARRALGQGELARARQKLARYAAQFEHGALQPESDVLGIELKMRTGAKAAAKAQAERFVAQYPDHPLRDRVRELVSTR